MDRSGARLLAPIGQALQKDDFRRTGLRFGTALGRRFNARDRPRAVLRRREYETRFAAELASARRIELADGFAIDDTGALPHLDEALAACDAVIAERAGQQWEHEKPFLQDISPKDSVHPALLDFILSDEVLAAVAPIFGAVPVLSGVLPGGVRLMESSTRFDPQPEGPWRESQLYHLDYHATPTVYVIVAVRDIGPDDGPLHYLGRAASDRVARAVGYGRRRVPYRLTDEMVHAHVDPSEVHVFTARRGTVLFIESSACLHFGSRCPANDRYHLQYAFTHPVRNDFTTLWRPQRSFRLDGHDELRRLVIERTLR